MLDNSVKLSFALDAIELCLLISFHLIPALFLPRHNSNLNKNVLFLGCIAKKLASNSGFPPVIRIIEPTSHI